MTKIKPESNTDNPLYYIAFILEGNYTTIQEKIDKAYQNFKNGYKEEKSSEYLFFAAGLNNSILTQSIHDEVRIDFIMWYHQLGKSNRNPIVYKNYVAHLEGNIDAIITDDTDGPQGQQKSHIHFMRHLHLLMRIEKMKYHHFIKRLKALTTKDYETTSRWGSAYAYYSLGIIYTKLGQLEDAIYNLEMARKGGFRATLSCFKYDKELAPLISLPAFEELNKPIWPEIKD